MRRVLIDTRDPYDASLLGYDGRTDLNDGGLIVTLTELPGIGPSVVVNGRDGEVEFIGEQALRVLGETLLGALKITQAKTRKVA